MDRKDMGSNLGKDQQQVSIVTEVVKEVAKVPVWAKLTPSTTEIVEEARRGVQRRRATRSCRRTRFRRCR